jgi:hypothetical protein
MKRHFKSFCILFVVFTFFSLLPLSINGQVTTSGQMKEVRFTNGSQALNIPFEMTDGGHIFLRIRANNSEALLFGLDSGFEQTAMSTKQAKALNLSLYGETQVTGGGEDTEDFAFAKNISFALPGITLRLQEIGVLALDFLPR